MDELTWSLWVVFTLLTIIGILNSWLITSGNVNTEQINSANFSALMISLPILLLDYLI